MGFNWAASFPLESQPCAWEFCSHEKVKVANHVLEWSIGGQSADYRMEVVSRDCALDGHPAQPVAESLSSTRASSAVDCSHVSRVEPIS